MKLLVPLIVVTGCLYFGAGENTEIFNAPKEMVSVRFKKLPFMAPKIELRSHNGKVLATKIVSKDVESKDVEIHMTDKGIAVFPGDSDWLWDRTLWHK